MNFNKLIPPYMHDSEEFKPSLKKINEDIRLTKRYISEREPKS